MENKSLPMPVIVSIIVVVVLVIGFFGWHAINGHQTGANGVDISTPGQQPASAQGADVNHK